MQCAAHPNVETYITCGKCGTPICPKCLVQTPVGQRCRDCAHAGPRPWEIDRAMLLRAILAGGAVAVLGGLLWGAFGGAGWLVGAATGFAISQAIEWGTRARRGVLPILLGVLFMLVTAGIGAAISLVPLYVMAGFHRTGLALLLSRGLSGSAFGLIVGCAIVWYRLKE